MEPMTTRNVVDLPAGDRAALEHLLGRPLSTDQSVFIMAFVPAASADGATRAEARERLEKTFNAAANRAASSGITAEEADSAVEEAMRHVRPRTS